MQTPSHFVTGIAIDKLVSKVKLPQILHSLIVGAISYLSHGVLDILSRITYHPPDAQPEDRFWWYYHRVVLPITTIGLVVKYWRAHKLSMICSVLPDLDWVVRAFRKNNPQFVQFWCKPILNESVTAVVETLPAVRHAHKLPHWKQKKSAALVEVGLFGALFGLIVILNGKTGSHR